MVSASKSSYEELRLLYKEPTKFRKFVYDLILWIFVIVFDCFFREIKSRGGYRVPKNESIIFVAAPHANQFVDPIILMSQVKKACGRRVSCLIAEKSHRRKFIGLVSRSQLAIPVKRAQDNLSSKKGTITLDSLNNLRVIGKNTKFMSECEVKGLLALPKTIGTADIAEIVSDTELYLKKPFKFANEEKSKEGKELLANGVSFKSAPKIDQSEVYAQVFEHLAHHHCLGVFSEGGSHDRPDLLPLKAGVAIMALGAMEANPGLKIKIVPVGMNYFHAHKFRSRAVVEFGFPIEIPKSLVEKYSDNSTSREAIKELLAIITKGLEACTVSCPDFETLSVVQAARRLYANNFSAQLGATSVVEMNRRLVNGFLHFEDEPKTQEIKRKVLDYNDNLKSLDIADHSVSHAIQKNKFLVLADFLADLLQVIILSLLALPGAILFAPIFIATKKISEKKRVEALAGSTVKIKGNDVIATWKILVSMGLSPILYTFYSTLGIFIVQRYYSNMSRIMAFILFYCFSVSITYSALIFGDRGMDLAKSLKSNWLMLSNQKGLSQLQEQREQLSKEITEYINEIGPSIYPDFNLFEYEKKEEKKRLRKIEKKRSKIQGNLNLDSLDSEDQLEELKTQELRQRRLNRKQNSQEIGDVKREMMMDTKIIADIGDSASTSEVSEGETSENSDTEDTQRNSRSSSIVELVREKIMEARENDE